jgi:hypothetical protein
MMTRPLSEKLARKHKKQVEATRRSITPAPFLLGDLVRFIPYEYEPAPDLKPVLDWLKRTRTPLVVTEVFEGHLGTGEQLLNPNGTAAFWSDCKCERPACKHEIPVLDATEDGYSVVDIPEGTEIPEELLDASFKFSLDWEAQLDWWSIDREPEPEEDEADDLAPTGPVEAQVSGEFPSTGFTPETLEQELGQ